MSKTCADHYTADELAAMRAWIEDACTQALEDVGLTVDDLDDEDVVIGVANHHFGGINGFLDVLYADA